FLCKSFAACIERLSIERGVAVETACDSAGVTVALENGAKRGWNGDPAFGVDLVCECRDKAVHPSANEFRPPLSYLATLVFFVPDDSPCGEPAVRAGFVSGGRRAERVSPETTKKGAVAVARFWALYQIGAQPRCPARCGRAFMGSHGI